MDALPEFLRPRLRLFLSADIVGSTALKQSPRDRVEKSLEWYTIIQGFYAETQEQLRLSWEANASASLHFECGQSPNLWKVIGDEITFTKVITDHRQVAFTLACWIEAIDQVRKFVRSRSDNARLDVKCTAWTAGFPVMNKEVVVKSKGYDGSGNYFRESGHVLNDNYAGVSNGDYVVDYIGPSIDIGFRLSQHATSRKFVISVGVAYIISITSSLGKLGLEELALHYDGAEPLKGVFGGAPYPVFWIDTANKDDLFVIEDKLTGSEELNHKHVEKYCEKFFIDNGVYTFKPFIETDSEPELKEKPEWYDKVIDRLHSNFIQDDVPSLESEQEAEHEQEDNKPTVNIGIPANVQFNSDLFKVDLSTLLESLSSFKIEVPDIEGRSRPSSVKPAKSSAPEKPGSTPKKGGS